MRFGGIFTLICLMCTSSYAGGNPVTTNPISSNDQYTSPLTGYNLPDAWRLSIAQPQGVLILYPDVSLFSVKSESISRWTPAVDLFLKAWQESALASSQLHAPSLKNNFVYLPTADWPSEFVEADFPDVAKLPLPDSVASATTKKYKIITVLSPWLKMRLFVSGYDLLGVQVYHNLTKLLSWQDDFFVYNLQHNVIPRDELDVNFGSDRFFNSFPLSSFSRNAFALNESAYWDDFLHRSRELSKENIMNSFKDKVGYDLELMSYAFLLSVLNPQPRAVEEEFARLPGNCSANNMLNTIIYQSLFSEIQQKLSEHPSTSTIIITRKEIYSWIEEEHLQNSSRVEAIGKQSCFNKMQ